MSEDKKTVVDEGLPIADFNSILALPLNNTKWVDVPEWGAKVKIKALTKAEQIKLRKVSSVRGVVDEVKLELNLLVFSLVEPRLSLEQVDELFAKTDAKAISRLSAVALAYSGLTEDYIGEANDDMKS